VDGVIHDTHDCSLNEWQKPPYVYGYYKKGVSVHGTVSGERKKLLDAVAKILALADSTDFEPEAETARTKAAKLIAKYDITADGLKGLGNFEAVRDFRVGHMPSYEGTLLAAVSKFCGVLFLTTPRQNTGRDYEFFGKTQDLEAFRYMREIVSVQQDHAWMDYLSAHPDCGRQRVSWKNSFSNGVAEKVDELLRAATTQQKALRQDLVLVPRHEQARAEFECLFGKLGSNRSGYGGEDNAHGYEAGKTVSLNKGVKSDGPARQITKRA
jgi:hypothetical protein